MLLIQKGVQLNVANMVDTGDYYALNGGIEPSGFTNNWNTRENTITISEGGNSVALLILTFKNSGVAGIVML